MLLNFNFLPLNNQPIENKIIETDYCPQVGNVIDFTEHLRNLGLAGLASDFEIKEINICLTSDDKIMYIIHCEPHHGEA